VFDGQQKWCHNVSLNACRFVMHIRSNGPFMALSSSNACVIDDGAALFIHRQRSTLLDNFSERSSFLKTIVFRSCEYVSKNWSQRLVWRLSCLSTIDKIDDVFSRVSLFYENFLFSPTDRTALQSLRTRLPTAVSCQLTHVIDGNVPIPLVTFT
jgi:hypothetical protein